MKYINRKLFPFLMVSIILFGGTNALAQKNRFKPKDLTDEVLVKSIPGFKNYTAEVNGTTIHYVSGGQGEPLLLIPGWPETWWAFHKLMPLLAGKFTVIAIDIRGMGTSGKPESGYDKKNMATDLYELVKKLGYEKVNIAGHDIGAQVAWSFAANFPAATDKLIMLDIPHPDQSWLSIPILPALGTFSDKLDVAHPFLWWFAFNQVKGLPEKILEGRVGLEQESVFKYLLFDETALSPLDRAVYAAAYSAPGRISAGNAWYQAFPQDIADEKNYQKLEMPVLGIGGAGYEWLKYVLPSKASNVKVVKAEGSGHFVPEEKPAATAAFIIDFLQ